MFKNPIYLVEAITTSAFDKSLLRVQSHGGDVYVNWYGRLQAK